MRHETKQQTIEMGARVWAANVQLEQQRVSKALRDGELTVKQARMYCKLSGLPLVPGTEEPPPWRVTASTLLIEVLFVVLAIELWFYLHHSP